MNESHKKELKIPSKNKLIETKCEYDNFGLNHKGWDTDTYWYNEVDPSGNVIAKYIVEDSTNTRPPFNTKITFEKIAVTTKDRNGSDQE
jgi:hypothetical protein